MLDINTQQKIIKTIDVCGVEAAPYITVKPAFNQYISVIFDKQIERLKAGKNAKIMECLHDISMTGKYCNELVTMGTTANGVLPFQNVEQLKDYFL